MKKIFLTMGLVVGFMATAQVKIGINPTIIDANSLLELETTNQGLLYPRVALQSTTSYAPLNDTLPYTKQPGMTVYNTATTVTGTNDVTPGLYVNDGVKWIPLSVAPVKNYSAVETASLISIDGKQVYGLTGTFITLGINALVTVVKPLGMTGYYKMTTYQNGKTFRSEISSFDINASTNNVVTGSGLFSEVYPAGQYSYTLEYFKS